MRLRLSFLAAFAAAYSVSGAVETSLPTPVQHAWHQREIMGLIHFEMPTFLAEQWQGCNKEAWLSYGASDPGTFQPSNLSTGNWVASLQDLGASHAVLTAKHQCGYLLWDSAVVLPDGSPYSYGVMQGGGTYGRSVVDEFVSACRAAGLGYGFYYTAVDNFYLNVRGGAVQDAAQLLSGQARVSEEDYGEVVLGHLKELWTRYGNLTEVWFDGGLGRFFAPVSDMLRSLQPEAAVFNGYNVSNCVRWIGTESGLPEYPIWSTADGPGQGAPNSPVWCPAASDTVDDTWFWKQGLPVRTLAELIKVYHATVGANSILELDFAIDNRGQVDPAHAQRYKEFGDWIRACYDEPLASRQGVISGPGQVLELRLPPGGGQAFDRVLIREDQSHGQRIREYAIELLPAASALDRAWDSEHPVESGSSVGNKRIHLLAPETANQSQDAYAVRLHVKSDSWPVFIKELAVFRPCPTA